MLLLTLLTVTMMVGRSDMEHDELVVETKIGAVRGERIVTDAGKKVDIWASVPFAEPPIGNLRYLFPFNIQQLREIDSCPFRLGDINLIFCCT